MPAWLCCFTVPCPALPATSPLRLELLEALLAHVQAASLIASRQLEDALEHGCPEVQRVLANDGALLARDSLDEVQVGRE